LWAPLAPAFVGVNNEPRDTTNFGPLGARLPEELLLQILGHVANGTNPYDLCRNVYNFIEGLNLTFNEDMWCQIVDVLRLPDRSLVTKGLHRPSTAKEIFDSWCKWRPPAGGVLAVDLVDVQAEELGQDEPNTEHPLRSVAATWVAIIFLQHRLHPMHCDWNASVEKLLFCLNRYGNFIDMDTVYYAIGQYRDPEVTVAIVNLLLNKVKGAPKPPDLRHATLLGEILRDNRLSYSHAMLVSILFTEPFNLSIGYVTFAWIGMLSEHGMYMPDGINALWVRDYNAAFEEFVRLVHPYLHRFNVGGDPRQPYFIDTSSGTPGREQLRNLCLRLAVFMDTFDLSEFATERYATTHPLPQIVMWNRQADLPRYFETYGQPDRSITEETPPPSPARLPAPSGVYIPDSP